MLIFEDIIKISMLKKPRLGHDNFFFDFGFFLDELGLNLNSVNRIF